MDYWLILFQGCLEKVSTLQWIKKPLFSLMADSFKTTIIVFNMTNVTTWVTDASVLKTDLLLLLNSQTLNRLLYVFQQKHNDTYLIPWHKSGSLTDANPKARCRLTYWSLVRIWLKLLHSSSAPMQIKNGNGFDTWSCLSTLHLPHLAFHTRC